MLKVLVASSKGGCGKTTIATNLAAYYAQDGKNTVLVDTDRQGSSQRWCEKRVGYGSPVLLVPPDRQDLNQYSMWWRLFIQRGDCGHELGIVIGTEDPVEDVGESHGLRSFSVMESLPANVSDGQGIGTTKYVFDGARYVSGPIDYR